MPNRNELAEVVEVTATFPTLGAPQLWDPDTGRTTPAGVWRTAPYAGKPGVGKHVRYVDMSALTTADLSDALHPNDAGYKKMADAFNSGVQAADDAGWSGRRFRCHRPRSRAGLVRPLAREAGFPLSVDTAGATRSARSRWQYSSQSPCPG